MSVPAIREESRPRAASATVAKPAPGMNRVLFLLSLSVLINYIDRSNLSIAAPLLQSELGISNTQLGTLLSAFFWIYALMQIPAGWLVDRFDVKWVFALGFFIWSSATAVTGLLHGFIALFAVRLVLGIGESVAFPSYGKILCGHFSEENRGFANGLLLCGLALGPAFGMFSRWKCRRPFWLAAVLSRAWPDRTVMASAVGSLDAPPLRASRTSGVPVVRMDSDPAPAIGLGYGARAGSDQLLPVFSGHLVAIVSRARTRSLDAYDGPGWRPAVSDVRDLYHRVWANFPIAGSARVRRRPWYAKARCALDASASASASRSPRSHQTRRCRG